MRILDRTWEAQILLLGALLAGGGCGGSVDHRLDEQMVEAEQGTLIADFEMSSPGKGLNELHINLLHANGEPVKGASVAISPWMPAHGHGSRDTTAVEGEHGHYMADDVFFNMTGAWELHVEVVDTEQATSDFVVDVQVR